MSGRDKLLSILMAIVNDEDDFGRFMKEELSLFFSLIDDTVKDSNGSWDDIVNEFVNNNHRLIDFVYEELNNFY